MLHGGLCICLEGVRLRKALSCCALCGVCLAWTVCIAAEACHPDTHKVLSLSVFVGCSDLS